MAWVKTDSVRGPKGDPGSIASASVEMVPAGQQAAVVMSGTDAVKHAHFLIPRGWPGMNAVPADAGVAAYVGAFDSLTAAALNGSRPVYRLWDPVSSSYPPRVPGAVNIFFGDQNPGLGMDASKDYWAPGITVIVESVAAAAGDTGSRLYAALQAATANMLPIPLNSVAPTFTAVGSEPNVVSGLVLPDSGTSSVLGSVPVPNGWEKASLRFAWTHEGSPVGNVRWLIQRSLSGPNGPATGGGSQETSQPAIGAYAVARMRQEGTFDVAAGQVVHVRIARRSTSSADTFDGPVIVTAAWLVKEA